MSVAFNALRFELSTNGIQCVSWCRNATLHYMPDDSRISHDVAGPHASKSLKGLGIDHWIHEPRMLSDRVPEECPEEVLVLIDACLSEDPAQRPSAVEVFQRLNALRKPVPQ